MIEISACPACASKQISILRRNLYCSPPRNLYAECRDYFERRLWLLFRIVSPGMERAEFTLCHCKGCDLLFSNPRFSEEEISRKYQFLVENANTAREYGESPLRHIDRRARRIFHLIEGFLPELGPAKGKQRIADVGGQFGHNLKFFPSQDFEKTVVDYEAYDHYPDLTFLQPDWESISEDFDLIMSNHTVEHMSMPSVTLGTMVSHLRENGLLYLEVPLGAFREAYNLREPLTHCNFFSERSLFHLVVSLGLEPLMLETSYQWITDHPEHCLNIVAKKGRPVKQYPVKRAFLSSSQVKGKLSYYCPLVARKVFGIDHAL